MRSAATSLLQEIARFMQQKKLCRHTVDTADFLCINPPRYYAADATPYLIPGLEIATKVKQVF